MPTKTRKPADKPVTDEVVTLSIEAIKPNPDQPRKHFDEDALHELAASIGAHGLLQPIVVRPAPDNDGYQLIAGERRFRAAQLLSMSDILARVVQDVSDDQSFLMAIAENVGRQDMTTMEEANAYGEATSRGLSIETVASIFGKSETYIRRTIDLLGLIDEVKWMIDSGNINFQTAWYMAKLSPAGQQAVIRKHAKGKFLSDSDAIAYAQAVLTNEQQGFLLEVQEQVTRQRARRDEARAAAEDAVNQRIAPLAAATVRATELSELGNARAIAAALGLEVPEVLSALDELYAAVLKARREVRKAAALVEVSDGE